MKFTTLWLQLLALAAVCVALAGQQQDADTTTSTSATIAWVTVTTNGQVNTVKTTYKQTFMSTFSDPTASVQAGTIGMGSQSGTVGGVRTYSETTISNAGGMLESSLLSAMFLFFGWLL